MNYHKAINIIDLHIEKCIQYNISENKHNKETADFVYNFINMYVKRECEEIYKIAMAVVWQVGGGIINDFISVFQNFFNNVKKAIYILFHMTLFGDDVAISEKSVSVFHSESLNPQLQSKASPVVFNSQHLFSQ